MCSKKSGVNLFQDKLDGLKAKGRYRSLSLPNGVDLTSNDYLGLAEHPYLRDAAIVYLENGGNIGAGGSRLLRGHAEEHAALEVYATEFFAAPKALYFSSGFQANATLFQTLCSRHDTIIFDEFVHASAREGIQNSHAQHLKAQHNDVSSFEVACKKAKGRIWIAVESVYSMDGDIAPLDELYALAKRYDAMLVIDEAHGTGVMGASGKGVSEALIAQHGYDRIIVLHTCGKAIGVAGGLLCASSDIVEMMVNAARGFVYSTAPMPLQAHLVQKSLELIASDEGKSRREKLAVLSEKAQQFFGGSGAHVVPIVIGDDAACVDVAQKLQQKGWDIRAIRPPTVPEGTARLRLSLSAALDEETLARFAADYESVKGGDR
jgi:8-amino-7-oxononanoate synthase